MNSNVQLVKTILKYTFGIVPIVAGLDKFINVLTDWGQYISEGFAGILPFDVSIFMALIGVVEIIAGIIVLIKTKIGAYIVAAWLILIALTLLFSWSYVDVAVRDLVMAIAAFSLAKLWQENTIKARN